MGRPVLPGPVSLETVFQSARFRRAVLSKTLLLHRARRCAQSVRTGFTPAGGYAKKRARTSKKTKTREFPLVNGLIQWVSDLFFGHSPRFDTFSGKP